MISENHDSNEENLTEQWIFDMETTTRHIETEGKQKERRLKTSILRVVQGG